MTWFTTSVFLSRNRVSPKEAFEGLELCERKLSCTVLRGLGGSNPVRLLGNSSTIDTRCGDRFLQPGVPIPVDQLRPARPCSHCGVRLHKFIATSISLGEYGCTPRAPLARARCSLQPNRRCLQLDHTRTVLGWSVSIRPWVEPSRRLRSRGCRRHRRHRCNRDRADLLGSGDCFGRRRIDSRIADCT